MGEQSKGMRTSRYGYKQYEAALSWHQGEGKAHQSNVMLTKKRKEMSINRIGNGQTMNE